MRACDVPEQFLCSMRPRLALSHLPNWTRGVVMKAYNVGQLVSLFHTYYALWGRPYLIEKQFLLDDKHGVS